MNQSTSSYNQMTILPFQVRFESALKEQNIIVKCQMINDLIQESFSHNIKEIQHRFVLLIEDIFDNCPRFGTSGWKLSTLIRDPNLCREFDIIFSTLCVDGPIFKLIRHLMGHDPQNRYQFPISYLPPAIRIKASGDYPPNSYSNSNKILQSLINSNCNGSFLNLNAFEFYMFHFASYIAKDRNQGNFTFDSGSFNQNDKLNVLYYVLLENYLEFFLPVFDNTSKWLKSPDQQNNKNPFGLTNQPNASSLWNTLSSTTTNFLNLSSSSSNSNRNQWNESINKSQQAVQFQQRQSSNFPTNNNNNPNYNNSNAVPRSSMLFNSKIFALNNSHNNQQQQNYNVLNDMLTNDVIGSICYKCETVLGIFMEIWLNVFDYPQNEDNLIHYKMNSFNISTEHIRVVRIFIKHLHYFSNSCRSKYGETANATSDTSQLNSGGFVPSNLNDPLEDVKRNVWSGKYNLQKNLYDFFRVIFERWPNDSSFRVPLEAWLSYIQPWRYVPSAKNASTDIQSFNDRYEWKRFVSDNIFFYTVLFSRVITRMSKQFDLNVSFNSFLVFRVLKVFAQHHLKDWIKDAEFSLMMSSNLSYNQSPISFRHQHQSHSPNKTFMIDNDFHHQFQMSEYTSIFSPAFRDQIIELLLKIAKFLYQIDDGSNQIKKHPNVTPKKDENWFMSLFTSTLPSPLIDRQTTDNMEKMRFQLKSSIDFIAKIFEIPEQSITTILNNAEKAASSKPKSSSEIDSNSIYHSVDGIPQLTEYGRNQILNGSLKLNRSPQIIEGNPDTQPVRSFEIAILVHLALFVSTLINKKFGKTFKNFYNENNIYGTLAKLILCPPVTYTTYEKRNNLNRAIRIEQLGPRINLRFVASIYFIFYFSFYLIFGWFFYLFNSTGKYLLITFITSAIYFAVQILM